MKQHNQFQWVKVPSHQRNSQSGEVPSLAGAVVTRLLKRRQGESEPSGVSFESKFNKFRKPSRSATSEGSTGLTDKGKVSKGPTEFYKPMARFQRELQGTWDSPFVLQDTEFVKGSPTNKTPRPLRSNYHERSAKKTVIAVGQSEGKPSQSNDKWISYESIVPVKVGHRSCNARDPLEGREERMNVARKGNKSEALTSLNLSTKLSRLVETAKASSTHSFSNIAHLIDTELLERSFWKLKRYAAPGVNQITRDMYEENLVENLRSLHQRLKDGTYRAEPLKRTHIRKENGKLRPLSIPVLEDKIVQAAVVTLMNCIYEDDFYDFSYGYRLKKSALDGVYAVQNEISIGKVSFVLDADISDFFGSIDREQLIEFVKQRITDKNILRLIRKWLKAGVIENGKLQLTDKGTYQGSVISPILANIYLHYVLDQWFKEEVETRLKGKASMYRFADDFIICFQYMDDAKRTLEVLKKRFAKFSLELQPEKTRLIEFGRYAEERAKQFRNERPKTFDFLGFTYICGKTLKGKFTVTLQTSAKRFRRSVLHLNLWCMQYRHRSLEDQHKHITSVLLGHYNYYGRRGNTRRLKQFYRTAVKTWQHWLNRRDNTRAMNWDKFNQVLRDYPLPRPRITEKNEWNPKWREEFI
jgi:RNA-directed DNA polymerase